MSDLVKVKAKKPGFVDGQYRMIGDVFEIDADLFSDFWLELADEPVLDQSQEAEIARREGRQAALSNLGDALAGNPIASAGGQFDGMSDDALAAYYETVMGEKPHHAAKRETLIAKITEKLNAD